MACSDSAGALALLECREGDAPLDDCLIENLISLTDKDDFCTGKYALRLLKCTIRYINNHDADWARHICQKIIASLEFSEVLSYLTEEVLVGLLKDNNYNVYDNLLDCITIRAIEDHDDVAIQFISKHQLIPISIKIVCSEDFGEDDTGPNLSRPLMFSHEYPDVARVEDWDVKKIFKRLRYSRQSFEIFCSILESVVQLQRPPQWMYEAFNQDWSMLYDHYLGEHYQDPVVQLTCRLFRTAMGKIDYKYLRGMATALMHLYEDEVTGQGLYDSEDYSQALRDFVMFLGFGVPEAQSHCQFQFQSDPLIVASEIFTHRELNDLCYFDYEFEEIYRWFFEHHSIALCPDPIFLCFVHMVDTEDSFEFVKEKQFSPENLMALSTQRIYRILRQMVRFEYSIDYLLNDIPSLVEDYIISSDFAEEELYHFIRQELARSLIRQRKIDLGQWTDRLENALLKMNNDREM